MSTSFFQEDAANAVALAHLVALVVALIYKMRALHETRKFLHQALQQRGVSSSVIKISDDREYKWNAAEAVQLFMTNLQSVLQQHAISEVLQCAHVQQYIQAWQQEVLDMSNEVACLRAACDEVTGISSTCATTSPSVRVGNISTQTGAGSCKPSTETAWQLLDRSGHGGKRMHTSSVMRSHTCEDLVQHNSFAALAQLAEEEEGAAGAEEQLELELEEQY